MPRVYRRFPTKKVYKTKPSKKYNRTVKRYVRYTKQAQSPAPRGKVVKIKYFQSISLNSAAGAIASYNFAANGCHDPDTTGAGHQPMYWDQLELMYNRYEVIGSKISATFTYQNTTASSPMPLVGIQLDDDGTLQGSIGTLIERGSRFTKWGHLGMNQANSTVMRKITHNFSERKYYGKVGEDSHLSPMGGNPVPAYFIVFYGPQDGTTELNAIIVDVLIEYIVRLTEPKEVAQSTA